MLGPLWKWVALFAAAGLAAGAAARLVELSARRREARLARLGQTPPPAPYVPQKSYRAALAASAAFLGVALLGGHTLLADLGPEGRLRRAQAAAAETFRATPLLRALAEAEPMLAETLRARYVSTLDELERTTPPLKPDTPTPDQAARATLLRQASREALALAMTRLANASDEAAARLAEALLASLRTLNRPAGADHQSGDPLLCLGLLHPASTTDSALTETALDRLPDSTRKQLDSALALVLASSTLRPHAAPLPSRADAALADMFTETLPEFHQNYGGPKEVRALFEALADPNQSRNIAPELLCSFAQDLLRALLRMHPEQRGDGLRRLLGAG